MRGDPDRDSLRLRFVFDSCWGDVDTDGPLPEAREEGGRRWWCEEFIRNRAFAIITGGRNAAEASPGETTAKRHAAAVDTSNTNTVRSHREWKMVLDLTMCLMVVGTLSDPETRMDYFGNGRQTAVEWN